ncbi:MAG: hypothetical protein EOQ39_34615 [Mesorhizobium sp.]|uniref:hypothetical protein n=1 Tax=Mesorhizobium sp. TaxID=1871066 RepID=UPI000FE67064|nr:hypothetical protein [Mesorhizobium sp.]RWB09328.1 MAG: hypothetical protein EOQ39_34615 [Mesorhizobium sp.]
MGLASQAGINSHSSVAQPDLAWAENDYAVPPDGETALLDPWEPARERIRPLADRTTASSTEPFSVGDSEWHTLLAELEQVFVDMAESRHSPTPLSAVEKPAVDPRATPEHERSSRPTTQIHDAIANVGRQDSSAVLAEPLHAERDLCSASPPGGSEAVIESIVPVAAFSSDEEVPSSPHHEVLPGPRFTARQIAVTDTASGREDDGISVHLRRDEVLIPSGGIDPLAFSATADDEIGNDWNELDSEFADTEWFGDAAISDGFDEADSPPFEDRTDLNFFDLDLDAHQSPWARPEGEPQLRRARMRAAALVSMMDLASRRKRETGLRFLTDFFIQSTSSSTFKALQEVARHGVELDTLMSMVALRALWAERPEWWIHRWAGSLRTVAAHQAALSWRLAEIVCLARVDHEIETMIDESWLDEWHALPIGTAGYASFPAYIVEKVSHLEDEAMLDGSSIDGLGHGRLELTDDYSWHRKVGVGNEDLRRGFHFLTPWDDRPGVIRPCPERKASQG